MSVPAVTLRRVGYSIRGTTILEDIDFSLESGEFLGIIGPNGGGKTTLLKLLLGLVTPDRGEVRVFGRGPRDARGTVAYVPQFASFDLQFPIRVLDLVLMGRLGRSRTLHRLGADDHRRAVEALERVDSAGIADRQIGNLSGGELQRALIARALATEARILLLDEPTASLDSRSGTGLYDLLSGFRKTMTVILVSHDVGLISRYVTSVACLNRKLYYHGSKDVSREIIEAAYGCPMDVLVHSHSHREVPPHAPEGEA